MAPKQKAVTTMRSIHPGIWLRPRSNVALADVHSSDEPKLSLVLPTELAKVVRRRPKHNGLILVMVVCLCVFAAALATVVLFPALTTLVGAGGEGWTPQGP